MYLTKKTYVKNWKHTPPEDKVEIKIKTKNAKKTGIKSERVSEITEEVGYWRKANAIHAWIVRNVQDGDDDCKEYDFPREKMQELLEICKEIEKDHLKAPRLLPTQAGFFFGEEEYDEYYFETIDETIKLFTELLKENNGDFYYQSNW